MEPAQWQPFVHEILALMAGPLENRMSFAIPAIAIKLCVTVATVALLTIPKMWSSFFFDLFRLMGLDTSLLPQTSFAQSATQESDDETHNSTTIHLQDFPASEITRDAAIEILIVLPEELERQAVHLCRRWKLFLVLDAVTTHLTCSFFLQQRDFIAHLGPLQVCYAGNGCYS